MHVVFALSAAALLFVTIWMMVRDFDDEWRVYQRQGRKLTADQLKAKENAEQKALSSGTRNIDGVTLKQAEQKAADAKAKLETHKADIDRLNDEKNQQEGKLAKLIREVKFKRAERDARRADLGLLIRDLAARQAIASGQKAFDDVQKVVEGMEITLQVEQAKMDKITRDLAAVTKNRDDAEAEIKKLTADRDRLGKAYTQLEPDTAISKFKLWLMEQPIIDGFNGPYKINQIWLPDLTINLGGMRDVARFDRCITCHVNLDKFEAGNAPSFEHNPHGLPVNANHAEGTEHGEPKGYRHPFTSHPRPDLYLTDASPHRMGKFGCTSCHDGQGSATSFQNASHTPNTVGQEHHWSKEHGYSHNHFWEAPMSPKRLMESGCIKCHHNVVELGVSQKFGASAPKAFQGYELVRKYGCFGCHEINGFNVGRQVGPDMRIEPQTEEEAARIAADPNATPGTMRKVGPSVRHIAAKTNKAWTREWISEPKKFRPETKMPQFFHLTGRLHKDGVDPKAEKYEPVEILAMTEFLFARSEKLELDHWAGGYEPNAERGKDLFSKRGCLACHEHNDFPGIKQDFGPNLSNAYAKIARDADGKYSSWLYTWLKEPSRHSARTKMPDLFLDPYSESGAAGKQVSIDPAADIMAFLLTKKDADGKRAASSAPADAAAKAPAAVVDELVFTYLRKAGLSEEAAKNVLETRKYPTPAKLVKGDEIELAGKDITEEVKLQYLGRRSVSRYGCYGCHDIPQFEKSRPIGTALQDWGRKDPSKLALEHIEEYLHFYGEVDPKTGKQTSTAARIEETQKEELAGETVKSAPGKDNSAAAFFYEQLMAHGRPGFLWQKVREPRSYDYGTLSTKSYDDRLRMPQFPFTEQEIEAIATFVLGLVADPPNEKYVYRPQGAAKARVDGEKALTKFNCTACHIIDLPKIQYEAKPEELPATELTPADHPEALKLLTRLKPTRDLTKNPQFVGKNQVVSFHGLVFKKPDPQTPVEEQEASFDLWETLKVGEQVVGKSPETGKPIVKDKLVLPGTRLIVPVKKLTHVQPARGGTFAEWLVDRLMSQSSEPDRAMAWQASPPPLYLEGIKVQTPWLYRFLKNPDQLRFTTVLRMPKFNMSDEEAQTLANYFAAYDGAEFPYQNVPERDPEYLSVREKEHAHYLPETWKLLNAPLCIKCHAVGGREYKAGDPKKDIRGPNLDRVRDRLRPEWSLLWLYKPAWITPYTSMPMPFPKNLKQFPDSFGGNAHDQVVGTRDALMNYLHLLEREGKVTEVTSTTDSKPANDKPQDAPKNPAEKKAGEGGR
jgi:cbb3-type cytochrome oxidase cytochrome c subunit